MAFNIKNLFQRFCTGIVFAIVLLGSLIILPTDFFATVIVAIFLFVLSEWFKLALKIDKTVLLLTPIYPVLPFGLLLKLTYSSKFLVLILMLSVFTFDAFAYLSGSLFGRHKILPQVSPNKSWEGFFGGYLALVSLLSFISFLLNHFSVTKFVYILFVSLAIGILALIGDFFESFIKRKAHVKDSSDILPGHGGFLDRFDAIMFVAPFFYLFQNLLLNIF